MGLLRTVRRAAYRTGSVLGDVEAVASGRPDRVVKRFLIRKPAYRATGWLLRKILP